MEFHLQSQSKIDEIGRRLAFYNQLGYDTQERALFESQQYATAVYQ